MRPLQAQSYCWFLEHMKPNFLEALVEDGFFFLIAFFLPFQSYVNIQDKSRQV